MGQYDRLLLPYISRLRFKHRNCKLARPVEGSCAATIAIQDRMRRIEPGHVRRIIATSGVRSHRFFAGLWVADGDNFDLAQVALATARQRTEAAHPIATATAAINAQACALRQWRDRGSPGASARYACAPTCRHAWRRRPRSPLRLSGSDGIACFARPAIGIWR